MSTAAPPLPQSISAIAGRHGLHRTEVYALITMHAVPTSRIGTARVVAPSDWPRLERLIRRYLKAKYEGAAASA
jgi:hypothetical protein